MLTYEFVTCLMLLVFGLSLVYPWHPAWPGAEWLKHLALLLLPLWLVYEATMPPRMNIRLDLPLILWGLMVAHCVYVVRLAVFAFMRRRRQMADATDAKS